MATTKEVTTTDNAPAETVVAHEHGVHCECSRTSSNRTLIIAVAATLILFTIGLILGYLLGRNTGPDYRGGSMMDAQRRSVDRSRMPMQWNTSTTQGSVQ